MPDTPQQALSDADAILARAQKLAHAVLALNGRRTAIGPAMRRRIGDRDGWICRVCGQPIDPGLVWQQADLVAIAEHEAHLAQWQPTLEAQLVEWIGTDVDRADVAWAWSLGKSWKDRTKYAPPSERKQWTEGFWKTLRAVSRQRPEHNGACGTVEHLVPVSMGGTNDEANLAIAHKRCNTHTGAAGASNTDLLAARGAARRFLADLGRLRDAKEIAPAAAASWIGKMVTALRLLGTATSDHEALEDEALLAMTGYASHYQALWDARRECLERAREIEYEGATDEFALRIKIESIDARMKRLKLPATIERWEAKRTAVAAELSRLRQKRAIVRNHVVRLEAMSGHKHDAAWWLALRDRLPEALVSDTGGRPLH